MIIPASTDTVMINIWKLTVNQTWTQGQRKKNASLHEQILSLSKHSNELLSGKDANVFYSKMIMIYEEDLHHKTGEKRTLISFLSWLTWYITNYFSYWLILQFGLFFTYLFKV